MADNLSPRNAELEHVPHKRKRYFQRNPSAKVSVLRGLSIKEKRQVSTGEARYRFTKVSCSHPYAWVFLAEDI